MPSVSRTSSKQASVIFREVPLENAFHFYRALDNPLSVSARSLRGFPERIATVEPASLAFHSEKRDFENWVSMLGDNELAKKLAGGEGLWAVGRVTQDEAVRHYEEQGGPACPTWQLGEERMRVLRPEEYIPPSRQIFHERPFVGPTLEKLGHLSTLIANSNTNGIA